MSGPVTPHAPVSARASLPPTGSATPALVPQPSASPLPPPATFDFLPDLHMLLSRLLAVSAQGPAPTSTPGQPVDDEGPLELKNLPGEAQKLRNKIQRAQRAVMALPDIDRTIEDQEDEIQYLEARITELRSALQRLGQPSTPAEDEDTSMTG